jgi:hypothetical protein
VAGRELHFAEGFELRGSQPGYGGKILRLFLDLSAVPQDESVLISVNDVYVQIR